MQRHRLQHGEQKPLETTVEPAGLEAASLEELWEALSISLSVMPVWQIEGK